MTLIPTIHAPPLAYRFPTTHALLAFWSRTWSSNAKRFAMHALVRAHEAGCDVLELPQVRYARADALLLAWERPHSERALRAARGALATIGALTGASAEDIAW